MACNVYQYLGERYTTSGLKVYYTEPDNLNYPDFDCSILSQALDLNFKTFKLTEAELLSCTSTNMWLSYCARAFGGGEEAGGETELLGTKVFEELAGEDWIEFAQNTLKAFENLIDHKAFGVSESFIKRQAPEITAKIEIARNWLSNIYSEYYGQKYLIEVGDSSVGICVKDRFGNVPSGTVKVDSDGGIFYSSDSPSIAGGWLPKFQNQVMGLSVGPELYPFTENDNRIGTFVKFNKTLGISKYNLIWDVDLGKLGDTNFYQKTDEELYVKASIDPSLYKIENKQYVLVTLDSPGELGLSPNSEECKHVLDSNGAIAIIALHGDEFIEPLRRAACDDADGDHTGLMLEFSNLNIFEMNKPRITPDSFCLPFKSNVFVYGPWFFQANPVGGTEVAVERELAPWNFSNLQNNGYDTMSYYGGLIAGDGPRGLQKQESGSITVAALPSYGIGYIVGGNAATLTDLQINIGESGYTTTYNFQTYTPKFGRPGRHLSDLWTRNYKSMSYINKFFKLENLKLKELINKTSSEIQKQKGLRRDQRGTSGDVVTTDSKTKGAGSQNTPNLFIYGGYRLKTRTYNSGGGLDYYDTSPALPPPCNPCKPTTEQQVTPAPSTITPGNDNKNQHVVMTEDSLHNTWFKENHFERFALNSLDLLYCPISTNQEHDPDAELPRLAMYHSYSGSFLEFKDKSSTALGDGRPPNSKPRLEIPPFYFNDVLQYDLPIHQMYLNSVTSTAMLSDWLSRINGSTDGFITNVITYGERAIDFSIINSEAVENTKQDQTNFRYNALRGPLTLQAWGYDTSGKPVPNAIDSAAHAEKGKFRRHGLQDKFLKNWLSNPKTWPAGPIDLRWDRERGVWVSPPSNKIVVARLLSNLSPFGMAEAELIDPQAGNVKFYEEYAIWSGDGANIKGSLHKAKIKVYDFLGVSLCKCDHVYAYYDDNRYIVLESNRAYKDPNQGCCVTTSTTETISTQTQPSQPTPTLSTNCWCDLECLKTLKNFKEGKHQALVHKQETSGPDCLVWEDIVECYTPPPQI